METIGSGVTGGKGVVPWNFPGTLRFDLPELLQRFFQYRQHTFVHPVKSEVVGVTSVNGTAITQISAEKFFTVDEIYMLVSGIDGIQVSLPYNFPAFAVDIDRGLIDIGEITL